MAAGALIVVGGLTHKRRELEREITNHEREIARLRADINAINRVVEIIDAGIYPRHLPKMINPVVRNVFNKGELPRLVINVLKKTGPVPLTLSEITAEVMKGREAATNELMKIRAYIGVRVRTLTEQGFAATYGKGRSRRWYLAQRKL